MKRVPVFRYGAILLAVPLAFGACNKRGGGALRDLRSAGYEAKPAEFLRAAASDDVEALRAFLKAGMSVGVTDAAGDSGLHAAARAGAEKAAAFLLDKGAKADAAGAAGCTPLMVAAVAGRAEMVRYLLRQGADPDLKDAEGYKPLLRAAQQGQVKVVEELAPFCRADLDAALLLASLLGKAEVIDVLTNYGASVYARMDDGRTPLMVAAENGHLAATKMLVEIGANRFAVDNRGLTAADLAGANGQQEIAAFLAGVGQAQEIGLEQTGDLADRMMASLEASTAAERPPAATTNAASAKPSGMEPPPMLTGADMVSGNATDSLVGGGMKRPVLLDGAVVSATAPAGGDSKQTAKSPSVPPLVLRRYLESELPVRVKSATPDKARIEVLAGERQEVDLAVGQPIPNSRLVITRIDRRVRSSKLDNGRPLDVSVVEVEDTANKVRREWVAGLPAAGHEPVALVEDTASGRRYVARQGARFSAADGGEYVVADLRANQLVLENVATKETVTLPLRGSKG